MRKIHWEWTERNATTSHLTLLNKASFGNSAPGRTKAISEWDLFFFFFFLSIFLHSFSSNLVLTPFLVAGVPPVTYEEGKALRTACFHFALAMDHKIRFMIHGKLRPVRVALGESQRCKAIKMAIKLLKIVLEF